MKIESVLTPICVEIEKIVRDLKSLRYLFHKTIQYLLSQLFPKVACHHYFTSSFYNDFKQFLKEQVVAEKVHLSPFLKEAAQEFINAHKVNKKIETYHHLTSAMRSEIENKPADETLKKLCYKLYTQDLKSSYEKLLIQELRIQSLKVVQTMQGEVFHQFLQSSYDKVALGWFYGDHRGPALYDPRMRGDLPCKIFEVSLKGRKIKVLRTPNVTFDGIKNGRFHSEVVPEFEGFLRNQQRHLYVNLMWNKRLACFNHEATRSDAIDSLMLKYPHFVSVSLDKDSFFYHQILHENQSLAVEFKSRFIHQMENRQNFRFPYDLNIKKELEPILNKIHGKFFKYKQKLSQQERKDFIELSYSAIIEYLAQRYKVKTMNVSCKSTVDRGASQLAMFHAYQAHRKKIPLDKGLITILTFAPALGAKNRAMLFDRFSRMQTTLKYLI